MQSTGRMDDYMAALRRCRRLLVGAVVLGTLAGAGAWFLIPPTYHSHAAVQVHALGEDLNPGESTGRTNSEVNLDTEAQIVASAVVASGAVERLDEEADPGDPEALAELSERIEVTVPPNSTVLEIAVADRSPGKARKATAAVVDSYLDHRSARVGGTVDARLDALGAELESKYAEVEELASEVAATEGAEQVRTQARLTTATEEAAALNAEGTPLRAVRGALNPGTVITPAQHPDEPSTPVLPLWLVGGALIGLSAGAAATAWLDRRHPAAAPADIGSSPRERDAATTPPQGSDEPQPARGRTRVTRSTKDAADTAPLPLHTR